MKRLIRIIFLLLLIQHIITSIVCTKDGNGCYDVGLEPRNICARYGSSCKMVPYCELAKQDERECLIYPVVKDQVLMAASQIIMGVVH